MSADLILVTGATGNTGSAVLQQLRKRGANVRAMVRAPSDATGLLEPPVETIVADSKSIDAALRGVARAYLVTPIRDERRVATDTFPFLLLPLLTTVNWDFDGIFRWAGIRRTQTTQTHG